MWRGNFAVSASFSATLKQVFEWCKTARTRLLLCLRLWGMWVAGEEVTKQQPDAKVPNARDVVRKFGTPVKLLKAFYMKLDVRLVLMNGSRCADVWQPTNWATRTARDKTTVVLNVWADHVSCYDSSVSGFAPLKPTENTWSEHLLATDKDQDDEHDYDTMRPFNWADLLEAWKDKRAEVFWTTQNLNKLLQQNARDHQLACKPHWAGPERCSYVDFPFCDGHRNCVRVKHVPEEHQEL